MKKVLSTLLAATLLLTTVTGLQGLSVSAEGAASTANNNELIANGDFESADTVVLADDFEGATAKEDWGNNTEGEALIGAYFNDEENNKCASIVRPLAHAITLKSNTTYTLSVKLREAAGTTSRGGIAIAVCEDARTADGVLKWNATNGVGGIYDAIAGNSVDKDEDKFTCPGKRTIWSTAYLEWTDYSFSFTTETINQNKTYFVYLMTSYNVFADDIQLVEKYAAKSNTVKGFTAVEDPDNAENHCLKLAQWNAPKVSNLAVESNTFYKFSYKYKRIDEADKESNLYCIIYHSNDSAASNQLSIFDTKGEVNTGYGATAFNSGAKLSTAADWQESSYIFKTGEVDSTKTWTLRMTVTGSQMYVDDFSLTKLVSDSEVSADFGFIGTAIKATPESENNQQLRFKAEVNKEALAAGHYNGFTVTEYGFLAFRKDYLKNQNSELTLNVTAKDDSTKATLQKPAYVADVNGAATTDIVFSETDTAKQFYARLTGFKVANYDKTYLVRTYAKLKNANGVELTVYVSDTTGLGVYDLAYAAFTATNSDGSYAESFETRTVLYNLLQGSSYKDSITQPQA